MSEHLRGWPIEQDDSGQWIYSDTREPTADTWKDRQCGHCHLPRTPEGHDGCLGTLPGITNACCGHGIKTAAYLQFLDGEILRGIEALNKICELQLVPKDLI